MIFQKIKEFIRRIKIKKIGAPKQSEIIHEKVNVEKETVTPKQNDNFLVNVQHTQLSDIKNKNNNEKLNEILKVIGYESKFLEKNINIQNVDVENFKKNLNELIRLRCSNIEMAIIIDKNKNILWCENQLLKEKIQFLIKYFSSEHIAKKLIYANSSILNKDVQFELLEKEKIFDECYIPLEYYSNIILENTDIFFMNKEKILNSLNIIKKFSKTYERFIKMIVTEPNIIGIENIDLLEKYA